MHSHSQINNSTVNKTNINGPSKSAVLDQPVGRIRAEFEGVVGRLEHTEAAKGRLATQVTATAAEVDRLAKDRALRAAEAARLADKNATLEAQLAENRRKREEDEQAHRLKMEEAERTRELRAKDVARAEVQKFALDVREQERREREALQDKASEQERSAVREVEERNARLREEDLEAHRAEMRRFEERSSQEREAGERQLRALADKRAAEEQTAKTIAALTAENTAVHEQLRVSEADVLKQQLRVKELENQTQVAELRARQLVEERDAAQSRASTAQTRLDQAERGELPAASERAATAEKRVRELETHLREAVHRAELAQAAADHSQTDSSELRERVATLTRSVEESSSELKKAEVALEASRTEATRSAAALGQAAIREQALEERVSYLEGRLQEMRAEGERLNGLVAQAGERLREQEARHERDLREKREEVSELRAQLEAEPGFVEVGVMLPKGTAGARKGLSLQGLSGSRPRDPQQQQEL